MHKLDRLSVTAAEFALCFPLKRPLISGCNLPTPAITRGYSEAGGGATAQQPQFQGSVQGKQEVKRFFDRPSLSGGLFDRQEQDSGGLNLAKTVDSSLSHIQQPHGELTGTQEAAGEFTVHAFKGPIF